MIVPTEFSSEGLTARTWVVMFHQVMVEKHNGNFRTVKSCRLGPMFCWYDKGGFFRLGYYEKMIEQKDGKVNGFESMGWLVDEHDSF